MPPAAPTNSQTADRDAKRSRRVAPLRGVVIGEIRGDGGMGVDWSAAALSRAARAMWTDGPLIPRRMQHFRPYICPFDKLLVHVEPGSRVLDVGCGRGLFLGLLHHAGLLSGDAGAPSVGFDLSREALAGAKRMARRAGMTPTVRFEHGDATHGWPSGAFDLVSIVDVMHHLPAVARRSVVQHGAERLRPGGVLLYKDMTPRSWRALANTMHDLAVARQWVTYTPMAVVEHWARESGLILEHAESFQRLWYGHELRVFRRPGA